MEPRHFGGDPLAVGLVTRLGQLDVVFRIDGFPGNAYEALAPRAVILVDTRAAAINLARLATLGLHWGGTSWAITPG